MSSSISGNDVCLFKVFRYDGSHFADGDDLFVKPDLSADQRNPKQALQDLEAGLKLIAGAGQSEDLKISDRADVTDRRRHAPQKIVVSLVQGNGLSKMFDNPRFRQDPIRVY